MNKIRMWISTSLVRLANIIKPENPRVAQFYFDMMVDAAILGGSLTRIEPSEWCKESSNNKTPTGDK